MSTFWSFHVIFNSMEIKSKIASFEKSAKNIKVLYGGDGTLVSEWRKWHVGKAGKCLLPIRNYGLCSKHQELYDKVFSGAEDAPDLKQYLFPILRADFNNSFQEALSEFTVVGNDMTSAIRFNIFVNGKAFMKNVIANGVIIASKLGATGYFKSVARTTFMNGIGVAFICPTYSVPNIVLSQSDKVEFELARKASLTVTADKLSQQIDADEGWKLSGQAETKLPVVLKLSTRTAVSVDGSYLSVWI